MSPPDPVEQVVLLDESGRAVGSADKATVHHARTPLHLAFSCYLFDDRGRVLVTRRARTKRAFPGVWTNSCCGHPGPGEAIDQALRRRVRQELGTDVVSLTLVLPAFRYRAERDGVVENEMCPVFVAVTAGPVRPDPAEVAGARWERWRDFRPAVLSGALPVSPWCREQVAQLPPDPLRAPAGRVDDLPEAARSRRLAEGA